MKTIAPPQETSALGQRRVATFALSLHGDERGQMAIAFLLLMVFVMMMFGVALDAGYWVYDHRLAQNQADAAAHAGAIELVLTTQPAGVSPAAAKAAVIASLTANNALLDTNADGTPDTAQSTCTAAAVTGSGVLDDGMVFWATGSGPTARYSSVRVCVRRPSEIFFSQLLTNAVSTVMVSASATARYAQVPLRYALMAMDPDDCQAMNIAGGGTGGGATITGGGGTYTNSNATCGQGALNVQNNTHLTVTGGGANEVVGTSGGGGALSPAATTGVAPRLDPFRNVPAPPIPATCTQSSNYNVPDNTLLPPGRYCGNVTFGPGNTLSAGTYVFQGNVNITNSSATVSSQGQQVLLYMTCPTSPCDGATPGNFSQTGGSVNLTGTDVNSIYKGILLFVDRTGGGNSNVTLTGGGATSISGSIYDLKHTVTASGGSSGSTTLNISIVANNIRLTGGANLNMPWSAQTAPQETLLALTD